MTAPAPRDELRDRFRGALLGLAVGEAMGAPAEFLTAAQINDRYGFITEMIGGGVHEAAPGEAADATDTMLCLGESLADVGGFDPEDLMERYSLWFESGPRHVSLTVRAALISYGAGTHWDLASRRAHEVLGGPSAGNGSLIRCAPLGLRYCRDHAARHDLSQRESTLTHFDRLAGHSCAAFNDLLAAALQDALRERVPAIAAEFEEEDRRVSGALRDALEAEPEEICSSRAVLESLRTALWTVLHAGDFEDAVCVAVNLGDNAAAAGAASGALAGALYGEAGIPPRWLAHLAVRERVVAVADRLARKVADGAPRGPAIPSTAGGPSS